MRHYFQNEALLDEKTALNAIRQSAYPLKSELDLQPLFDKIGDARIVMLGEASHGTHEYYTWRATSQNGYREKGFQFIAVEGDWPDCYRLNRYVKGYDAKGKTAYDVLQAFNRWPTWMWANWEIVALAEWLQRTTLVCQPTKKLGFMAWTCTVFGRVWRVLSNIWRRLILRP